MSGQTPNQQEAIKEIEELANAVARKTRAAFLTEPTAQTTLALVRNVDRLVDEAIEKFQGLRPDIVHECKPGCSWCCHDIVLATVPEIVAVFEYLRSQADEAGRSNLRERLQAYEDAMIPKRSRPFSFTKERCPHLVDSLCSVYEVRPLGCRGKSSTSANVCRMWAESPGDGGVIPFFIAQKLSARAAERGLTYGVPGPASSGLYELNRCLKMLLDDPSLVDRVISGEFGFPPPVEPDRPRVFPADSDSVSPGGVNRPDVAQATAFADVGRYDEAKDVLRSKDPLTPFVGMHAPGIYSSENQIYECRERMNAALDDLEASEANALELLPALAGYTLTSQPYQGLPLKDLLQKQGKVFQKIVSKAYPHLCAPIDSPRKPGRFRLGYISGGLNLNNGSRWALGWLKNHSPEIERYAINLGPEDIGSRMWAEEADFYYCLQGNLQRIAEFVRGLDLDALIVTDLGSRKRDYLYFSMRLARIQCTAWGIPVTSGLPSIDYYLGSDLMEPDGSEREYTEKLVRLPRSGLCYPRPKSSFRTDKRAFSKDEFVPFMAQNLRKWTPRRDDLLKKVADRYGKPLKFVSLLEPEHTALFSKRLIRAGIHHELLPTTLQEGYANYLMQATVSFDPPDWSGGNTTIEALSYGIPVVTLPGEFMRGRHSLAFLKLANAEGLIAKDEEDYLALIFNRDRQEAAMENLNIDALYEDRGVVTALDEFLLRASQDG